MAVSLPKVRIHFILIIQSDFKNGLSISWQLSLFVSENFSISSVHGYYMFPGIDDKLSTEQSTETMQWCTVEYNWQVLFLSKLLILNRIDYNAEVLQIYIKPLLRFCLIMMNHSSFLQTTTIARAHHVQMVADAVKPMVVINATVYQDILAQTVTDVSTKIFLFCIWENISIFLLAKPFSVKIRWYQCGLFAC